MLNQIPERWLLLPHFIKQLGLTGKMPVDGAAGHSRRISNIRQGRVGHPPQSELLDRGLNQELPRA